MQLIKELLGFTRLFKDTAVVGLCGINKSTGFTQVRIPESYKKAYIPNYQNNFVLL